MARFEDLGALPAGEARVAAAAAALERGALLAHPTQTVYGIGGPATVAADREVARLKGRIAAGPMLRIAADAASVRALFPSVVWTEDAARLADRFWPGPLTLVLDDGSGTGLAVRAEAHPVTRSVLARWSGALGSTSLNPTGGSPARTEVEARRVLEALPGAVLRLLFLPGGDLPGPPPSTLVSLRRGPPRLLREGAIARDALEDALGREIER